MAAATVDVAYLAASYSVPQPQLQTLLDEPTKELVEEFLARLELKARDFDDLRAEKLRAEVELQTAKHTGETRAKALKATVDNGLKDVEELRRKLNDEENLRQSVEAALAEIKAASSNTTSETESLRTRIDNLETSNRETVALLEAKSTAHDKLAEELAQQLQKILSLRKEVSQYEEKHQTLENAALANKFKVQTQEQEIERLKKDAEWHQNELQIRNTEYTKFRKEKNAKIAELQRANEDSSSTVESQKRTEAILRSRNDELTHALDDALSKTQRLQEEAARSEESFRLDLNNIQRFAELHKERCAGSEAQLKETTENLTRIRDQAALEIGQLQAEVESERDRKELAEQRLVELESQVEKLETSLAAEQARALVATPKRGQNGSSTPGRPGSPFTPGSSRMKGSVSTTNTQLYSENARLKIELKAATNRCKQLSETLDTFVLDLEAKQPEIEELKAEQDRLTAEVTEMSALLEEATNDRESAARDARKYHSQVEGSIRESAILRQQLRDLSCQMRILLVELQAREQGLESLNGEQRRLFERVANGEVDEAELSDMSPVNQYISERLVIFRTVSELQERNTELLEATRSFAQQMEGEDAKAKARQQEQDQEELETLRDRCASFEDEVKSLNTRSQSYIKERDMYRRMLTHRGKLPPADDLASQFGQSIDGRASQVEPETSKEPSQARDMDIAGYQKFIKELQAHVDALKETAHTDHNTLRQQRDQLAKEKGTLQSENSKISSQLSLEQQRYELLNSTLTSLKAENNELRQRTENLRESAAKQDLRTQQVAEDLIEAKAIADGTKNEANNLKQLNDMLKRSETRLTEDNKSLLEERGRLNKLVNDLQTLQNERELSESENRRRLQNKSDALESELSTIKRKLDEEVEESKKAALRREYEQNQSRTQIDELLKGRQSIKEDLIKAQTERDLLNTRVEELKIELTNATARAEALQPRPTTRPGIGTIETDMDALTREQELAVEVADLKRDLELTKAEVEAANVHVENYKNIAQDAEEQLGSLSATSDQYRDETDALLLEKDARISDLEKRVDEITSELASTATELSNLQATHAEADSKFDDQKAILDAEISRFKDECERLQATANFHEQDKKTQADIAQQAQQSYENELVKHAEATTALQKIRGEHNELRSKVAGIKAEADTAKTALSQNEKAWSETKDRYEREITDLKTRREEISNQNKLLHQQLDNVSSQITSLRQSRSNGITADNDSSTTSPGPGADSLQEVIRYLRREKEIVDVQYEMSIQEQKRMRQQLDYTQTQLEQTRERLSNERQSQLDKEQSTLSHNQLVDTINELNVFRESSTTLRHEARQAQKQLAEKVIEVETLINRIQPLEARTQELENELENKNDTIGLLEKLRDELQQRNQNILSKYNRIDPAEHDSLKEQVTTLQTERDHAVAENQPLQEKIDGHAEEMRLALEQQQTVLNERRQKIIDQAKARDQVSRQKVTSLQTEKNEIAAQLEAIRDELESTKTVRDEALAAVEQRDTEMGDGAESGEVDEAKALLETKITEADARAITAESRAAQETAKLRALESQQENLQARISELEQQVNTLQEQLNSSNAELTTLRERSSDTPSTDTSAELEGLKTELASMKEENESLRVSATMNTGTTSGEGATGEQASVEQIAQQVNTIKLELESKHAERMAALEETFKKRSDNMKEQLNKKLREKNESMAKTTSDHEEAVNLLKSQHAEELSRVNSEHADEIARLNSGLMNQSQTTDGSTQPAATTNVKSEEATTKSSAMTAANGDATSAALRGEVLSSLTDTEVKDLIAKNPTVNGVVKRNIQTKLASEKEALTKSLNAEHDKALEAVKAEAATNIAKGDSKVKNAEMMLQKRFQIKMSSLENQRNLAQLKVGMVETAANETPQKPVVEVWTTVKDVKLPKAAPAQPPAPAVASTPAAALHLTSQQTAPPQPASAPHTQPQSIPAPAVANTPTMTQPRPGMFSNQNGNQGVPNAASVSAFGQPASAFQSSLPGQGHAQGLPPNPNAVRGGFGQRGGPAARGGPGQARSISGGFSQNLSQIPHPGSGIPRGGGIPRGRGRGGPRGGGAPAANQANLGANSDQPSSPMNPGASHFVPRGGGAQKRGRDDSNSDQAQKRAKSNEAGLG